MIHIKKFIDKVTHMEGRGGRDVVLPIADARGLRDELSKLLVDNNKLLTDKMNSATEQVIQVDIKGGTFK